MTDGPHYHQSIYGVSGYQVIKNIALTIERYVGIAMEYSTGETKQVDISLSSGIDNCIDNGRDISFQGYHLRPRQG